MESRGVEDESYLKPATESCFSRGWASHELEIMDQSGASILWHVPREYDMIYKHHKEQVDGYVVVPGSRICSHVLSSSSKRLRSFCLQAIREGLGTCVKLAVRYIGHPAHVPRVCVKR